MIYPGWGNDEKRNTALLNEPGGGGGGGNFIPSLPGCVC